jgi:hypothetical protein
MAIDPSTGMDIPSPSDDFRRRRPDDIIEVARDIEERSPAFWLPIAVAIVLLVGVVYYFFGPHVVGQSVRSDARAIVKSEPRPN